MMTHLLRSRLMKNRLINTETQCWEWTGTKSKGGYGQFTVRGIGYKPHRVSASLFLGFPLSSNLAVCHKCDNPSCFNPQHLFVGTFSENIRDAVQKGRWIHTRGEKNGRAKLSEDDVLQIRLALAFGASVATMAKRFGMSFKTVSKIKLRQRWAHI